MDMKRVIPLSVRLLVVSVIVFALGWLMHTTLSQTLFVPALIAGGAFAYIVLRRWYAFIVVAVLVATASMVHSATVVADPEYSGRTLLILGAIVHAPWAGLGHVTALGMHRLLQRVS